MDSVKKAEREYETKIVTNAAFSRDVTMKSRLPVLGLIKKDGFSVTFGNEGGILQYLVVTICKKSSCVTINKIFVIKNDHCN